MDANDLDYRARTLTGCIPPHLVDRLLELGHHEEVEHQARARGEWFCALASARVLAARGQQDAALEILGPFVATGWWTAANAMAGLLEEWGRAEEAIALMRPHAEGGDRAAVESFARLLARHGRPDEAYELLHPRIDDWFMAAALVDVAAVAGRDEDAATLLTAKLGVRPECACGIPQTCNRRPEPWNGIGLIASIRERQGRIDEAIALLHTRESTSVNNRDQLADLLARHDRIAELREYAAGDYHGHAAQRLAELLEEHGDVDGAIAVYRQPGKFAARRGHVAVLLANLLAKHGRPAEAIEVMRELADQPGGAEDWIADVLCTLYVDHGGARDGLDFLDALKVRQGGEEWEFFCLRLPLLVALGRRDEAVQLVREHAESDTWYAAGALAELLTGAGRIEEAVAVLEKSSSTDSVLAWHLIDLGRIKEAVTVCQQRPPRPVLPAWTGGGPTDEPPF